MSETPDYAALCETVAAEWKLSGMDGLYSDFAAEVAKRAVLSSLASAGIAHDPTAQTEPLTTGQKIVSWWETSTVSEPCELAQKIDGSLASMKEECARVAAHFALRGDPLEPESPAEFDMKMKIGGSIAAAIRALASDVQSPPSEKEGGQG